MTAVQCLVISCCLLAQNGEPPSSVPTPRFRERKERPAAPAQAGNEAEPSATDGQFERPAHGHGGPQEPAHKLMHDFDAEGGMAGDRGELRHVDPGTRRMRPPELLADALSGPHEGRVPSRPLPLVDALARASGREQQRQIAVAYWRLAIAQAQLHYARGNLEYCRRWHQPGHAHSTLSESQWATAEAAVEDAEFRVINDAEALASLVGWPVKEHLPSTVDRPHVGDYRTEFEYLFSTQTPPVRLRLIHRTLPISRRAIDVHGAALVAAAEALRETEEEYHQQRAEYLTLAAAFDHLTAEQTAFLASVLRYNEDIAEYALFVTKPTSDPTYLAKRLITRPAPTSHRQPESRPAEQPAAEETFDSNSPRDESPPRTFRRERDPGAQSPPDDSSAGLPPKPLVWLTAAGDAAENAHGGLYQGLLGSKPAFQAQRLTAILHWDRELPPGTGEKLRLVDCLGRVAGTRRRVALAAYWDAREQIARYQALGERTEMLSALANKLLALRAEPGGAEAMLRLEEAREATQAAVLDQHIRMLTAQFELMMIMEASPDQPWPVPSTVPHGGDYRVVGSDGSQSGDPASGKLASFGVTGSRVLVLHTELSHRAKALVFADEFRALHTPPEPRRPAEIDAASRAVDRQIHETEVFLATLTDYNLAVADFVLPLFPPETPAKSVVEKLVVEAEPAAGANPPAKGPSE